MKRIATPIETVELCSYGCGNIAKFINGSKKLMCEERSSKCSAVRKRNSDGLKKAHVSGVMIHAFGSSSRGGWSKGLTVVNDPRIRSEYDPSSIFTVNGRGPHKTILINERGRACESCGLVKWMENLIPLELDHIDGNNKNNTKENLKLLCPNCHALTPTWRGRGTNTGRKDVSDQDLLNSLLKNNFVIRAALMEVNMTPKGANYERCYQLITNHRFANLIPGVC